MCGNNIKILDNLILDVVHSSRITRYAVHVPFSDFFKEVVDHYAGMRSGSLWADACDCVLSSARRLATSISLAWYSASFCWIRSSTSAILRRHVLQSKRPAICPSKPPWIKAWEAILYVQRIYMSIECPKERLLCPDVKPAPQGNLEIRSPTSVNSQPFGWFHVTVIVCGWSNIC